jgi:hypothetical protein
LFRTSPIAATVLAFLVVAVILVLALHAILESSVVGGSMSLEGTREWSLKDLLEAVKKFPALPGVRVKSQSAAEEATASRTPRVGQTVYRVYGGVAIEDGRWWTPLDPHGLSPTVTQLGYLCPLRVHVSSWSVAGFWTPKAYLSM